MEKLGIAKEELVKELQTRYNELKERDHQLTKTGGIRDKQIVHELLEIKEKLDELAQEAVR